QPWPEPGSAAASASRMCSRPRGPRGRRRQPPPHPPPRRHPTGQQPPHLPRRPPPRRHPPRRHPAQRHLPRPPRPRPPRPPRPRGTPERMPRPRQLIARRMVESLQTSAQLTTVVEADVTEIARLRERAKADFEAREGVKLTFLPFFALATVEALKMHPRLN